MKRSVERVLCYGFREAEKLNAVKEVMRGLGIECRVLPEESWREQVGFLLGLRGFKPHTASTEEEFSFPGEVMVLHHIKGKRLDQVLAAMKQAGVPPIRYKAVVTPFNTFWTLRRLCETMRKEHQALAEGAVANGGQV
ncbi:MAG: DUF3783 domain-containing protein [Schwartzia sp.]|nr:DUF3783 domain-containing protein [Schwartzia sp. (in: firmicutes)]